MSDWTGSMNPSLDARLEGSPLFTATANSITEHIIGFDFACDFNGIEFYAWSSNAGDNLTFQTEYYAGPVYNWIPYKKFGKNFNVYPDHVTRVIIFPTKPFLGVRVKIKYDNKGTEDVKFSMNKFQFAEYENVNTAILDSGEDW